MIFQNLILISNQFNVLKVTGGKSVNLRAGLEKTALCVCFFHICSSSTGREICCDKHAENSGCEAAGSHPAELCP